MIILENPALLFHKEKIYRLKKSVAKSPDDAGNMKCRNLILYNAAQDLAPSLTEMLEKLLQACRFRPEETLKRNIAGTDMGLEAIIALHNAQYVICFGPATDEIKSTLPNSVSSIGKATVIYTFGLEHLKGSPTDKTALWKVLKDALKL